MGEAGEEVVLYVYDLTGGMAKSLGQSLLQKNIEGIWHTSIIVFGKEYFFGSNGISVCDPGTTALGNPLRTHSLGKTCLPEDVFQEYLRGLEQDTFSADKYNLLRHNCNNFSNEISQFLCGNCIPGYILDLPNEILNTPFGQQLAPILELFSNSIGIHPGVRRSGSDFESLNNDIDSARKQSALLEEKRNKLNEKLEKREKRKKKKKDKNKHLSDQFCNESEPSSSRKYCDNRKKMSENGTNGVNVPATAIVENDADDLERKELELKRKERDPPIVFPDTINVQNELERLVGLIDGRINPDDMQYVAELDQYMLENEGSWALGEGFLSFVGKLLNDDQLVSEVRETILNILAAGALKDDIILVLHQDRREHILMNYANGFDKLPLLEQLALTLFMCNLFENSSTSEWLLYISEWQLGSSLVSNIRVTTKVAVNSLLSEDKVLQDRGTALVHNLACKEVKTVVFDDVVVELAMAVLQYFNSKPNEENSFRCMKSLARFCQISRQDVPQLVQMIGPPPSAFKGISNRIDEQIAEIQNYLR
uniref:PPPDE peptidase domain-containing protein 2 n=1 Tax=Schizaphis graminum TaxID=13262 RepID=A0A2S2NM95_SCHGA